MEDKHVWKEIITTDPETHSKCMNNFVKQSFVDSKQNMIIFFLIRWQYWSQVQCNIILLNPMWYFSSWQDTDLRRSVIIL